MKTKFLFFTIIVIFAPFLLNAQVFNKTKILGSASDDQIIRIKQQDNFLYIIGYFSQSLKVDSAGIELTYPGNGGKDLFIGKFDTTLNPIWINVIGSNLDEGGDYLFGNIDIDPSGNIYVVGSIQNNCVFKSQTKADTTVTSNGKADGFLAKYTNSGNLIWLKTQGGNDIDETNDLALDDQGNVYIVGFYRNTATFNGKNGSNLTKTASAGSDGFVAKYDTDGNLLSAKSYGGVREDAFIAIKTSKTGSIYLVGASCCAGSSFSIDSITVSNTNGWGSYWAKFDHNLNAIWVNQLGTTNNEHISSIAISDSGDIYIAGHFLNSTIFPSQPGGTSQTINSVGNYDIMIARYDTNGVRKIVESFGSIGIDYASHIYIERDNNIYLTGSYSNVISFDSISLTSHGSESVFITKFNNDIEPQFALSAGSNSKDYGRDIAFDMANNIYLVGSVNQPAQFGSTNISGWGGTEGFLTKISKQSNTPVNLKKIDNRNTRLLVYPNPSTKEVNVDIDCTCEGYTIVYDMLGKELFNTNQLPSKFYIEKPGTYIVRFISTEEISTTKLIIQN
jgi:hypothetical protein